jgi:hypothetical protein
MQKAQVQIKGLEKYFFSKPTKQKKVPKTDQQKKDYAISQVYCNGNLFFPNRQIKGAMINGAQMAKLKIERSVKRTIDLFKTNFLMVQPEEIIFVPKQKLEDIKLEEDFIREAGIWSFFPYIDKGWTAEFEMIFSEIFEPEFIKEALENAGVLAGIGGRRPYNGTFEVVKFLFIK